MSITPSPGAGVTVGIDVGALKTMIVADDGDIVLTDTGSTWRPTLVAFNGPRRLIGEEALPEISGENTITMQNLLIGKSSNVHDSITAHRRLKPTTTEQGVNTVTVNFNDTQETFSAVAVVGMFLAKQAERIRAVYPNAGSVTVSFALPPFYDGSNARAIAEACQIAGIDLDNVRFTDAADCLLATYGRKLLALRGAERTAMAVR
jgi:molecular chaperone DnaK (HSP70)